MVFAQGLLAAICVVLGIGAPVIAPVLVDVRRVRAASVRWRVCRRGHGAHEPVLRRCHLHAPRSPLRSWCLSALPAAIASSRPSARCRSPSRGHAAMLPTSICPSWPRPLPPRCPGLCSRSTRCATAARPSAVHRALLPEAHRCGRGCGARTRQGLVDAPHKVSRSSPISRLSSRAATTASISATSSRHSWCSSCSPCKWVKEGRA